MKNILELKSVTKKFDDKILFEDVTFKITEGDISCLIGANGTGKSIFIDCILGFEPIDKGEILVDSHELADRKKIRKITGVVSTDHQGHIDLLTPKEYFEMIIGVYNLGNINNRLTSLINELHIESFLDTIFTNLSFGTKKKVQLVGCLLYDPLLLVCDEIFEGLDEDSIKCVKNIFRDRSRNNKATFFTTHIRKDAEDIATKFLFLKDQKISING